MLKITTSLMFLMFSWASQASLHILDMEKTVQDEAGYINLIKPLSSKDFSQHVTHFCLNQVEGFGLDSKFMTAYVVECAADYGVFNLVLK